MVNENFESEYIGSFTRRQQIFMRYVLAILIDLTVLNLLNQYWDYVYIETFTISLLAAILIQVLMQASLKIEHIVAEYFFKDKVGKIAKVQRVITAWFIIFISKLAIIHAISLFFGDSVVFSGPVHGVVAFIVSVVVMIVVEQIIVRTYHKLA